MAYLMDMIAGAARETNDIPANQVSAYSVSNFTSPNPCAVLAEHECDNVNMCTDLMNADNMNNNKDTEFPEITGNVANKKVSFNMPREKQKISQKIRKQNNQSKQHRRFPLYWYCRGAFKLA